MHKKRRSIPHRIKRLSAAMASAVMAKALGIGISLVRDSLPDRGGPFLHAPRSRRNRRRGGLADGGKRRTLPRGGGARVTIPTARELVERSFSDRIVVKQTMSLYRAMRQNMQ